jgi:drug/metabolite transporter (DMT)-like permease
MAGGWFPLRYYLEALYGVFNRGLSVADVGNYLNSLYYFIGGFLLLSLLSILFGAFERRRIISSDDTRHISGTQPREILS